MSTWIYALGLQEAAAAGRACKPFPGQQDWGFHQ